MRTGKAALVVAVLGLAAFLGGCSGADNPPPAPEGTTASGQTASPQSGSDSTGAACTEGATGSCARILDRRGDYVLCAHGTQSCTDGAWGQCTAQPGESDWYPADAPCEPCAQEGTTRSCSVQIGDQGEVHNCFKGKETCEGGFWSKCQ